MNLNNRVITMTLQEFIDNKGITRYQLSKISGIAKTTIADICTGRSDIERCFAKTVYKLSKALDCSMEEIMSFTSKHDLKTGL